MNDLAILGGTPIRTGPFSPWPQYTARDSQRLQEVLESRNWGGYPFPNRYATDFAARFAAFHGAYYGCCVANGTVAITIALRAAGLRPGDEVIVPAYTWDGTATAVLEAGCVPVFADVDPDSYCLSADAVRKALTPKTHAIVPVHLAMRFADMDALRSIASEHRLIIVEDCAHAHGGAWRGQGSGSMGDLGTFSFQSSKTMTSGEGGAIITSNLEYFELVQTIVNCGRASVTDHFGRRLSGGNYRMTEFQAAILVGQFEMLEELTERRARNARLLSDSLADIDGISTLPRQDQATREFYYNYVFRYAAGDSSVSRDAFVAALEAEGIPADGRFYEPVYRSDLFRVDVSQFPQLSAGRDEPVDFSRSHCPVSERAAYDEAVWIPQFVLLGGTEDVEDIAAAVRKVIAHREDLRTSGRDLAGVKSMSRAERPRAEKARNY